MLIVAGAHPDAAPDYQFERAMEALDQRLWVVLFTPSPQGPMYHAYRYITGHRMDSRVGRSLDLAREGSLYQGPNQGRDVLRTLVIKSGYRFVGGFDAVPDLGPGEPPAKLFESVDAVSAAQSHLFFIPWDAGGGSWVW